MAELVIPWEILPFFFVVAFLYSSVGHGGASGYLALFALFGIVTPAIAPVALILNVLVASVGWWHFFRGGFFSWRMLLPFVMTSIPAAFLGGMIEVPQIVFSLVLGVALLLAAVRIFFLNPASVDTTLRSIAWPMSLWIGGVLGFVSGMIGIGGGVFLSPLLLVFRWADVKRTAAISAAFIVLNSLSGLVGHMSRSNIAIEPTLPLVAVVFAGGFLGSRTGAFRLQPRVLRVILGIVLIMAGAKLVGKIVFGAS